MSRLTDAKFFGAADLPSPEMLNLHVTPDFLSEVERGQIEGPVIEIIAEEIHKAWKKSKEKNQWRFGPRRNDRNKQHPWLLPYNDSRLPEEVREANRKTARFTMAKLLSTQYEIIKRSPDSPDKAAKAARLPVGERKNLIKIEHDVWLRDHLQAGYTFGKKTNESLRVHRCMLPYAKLNPEDSKLDAEIVDASISALTGKGYEIVKRKK